MPVLNWSISIVRQYGASLRMLEQAVEKCPEALWTAAEYPNRFWHIAYHAVYYTYLYLQTSEADFQPWARHQREAQYLGQRDLASRPFTPYTKNEILEYCRLCRAEIESKAPALDLDAAPGFDWLPFTKLELQFYNIRHLQHHTGQLADRLRTAAGVGVGWVIGA